ncbi:MAG: Sensory histidine kinase [Candidatus Tokpelaia sp. JSC188]|nr:MAG: Sensory histidine kinase [Candidatus Tokpelaia sp. JSC188]
MNPLAIQQVMKLFEQKDSNFITHKAWKIALNLSMTKAMVEANHAHFILHSEAGNDTIVEITV